MPANRPMVPAITRTDALVLIGSRQARQLAWASALLRVRPVLSMPNKPRKTAIQRVEFGWARAVLIWSAIVPVIPASSTSFAETNSAKKPSTPTTNRRSGTKNRKRRKAMALPTTLPAASRSRS